MASTRLEHPPVDPVDGGLLTGAPVRAAYVARNISARNNYSLDRNVWRPAWVIFGSWPAKSRGPLGLRQRPSRVRPRPLHTHAGSETFYVLTGQLSQKKPAWRQSCRRGAVDARTWSRHAHGNLKPRLRRSECACHVRGGCHQAVFIAGHDAAGVRCRSHYSAANSSGASRGTTMRIFVPAPGLVSRLIRPPRRLVTMLWTMCNPRPVLP